MIGFLRGKALISNESAVLLDVSGVGYRVHCPLPLLVSVTVGQEMSLYIHSHIREDQFTLYGFKDELDLFLFEKLIGVSGIGPKSALAMLSVHSPASIADAVEREDVSALSHTPGVGKKTAEKIILELRGKLSHLVGTKETDTTYEVRLALETLGYSSKEIHDVLQKLHVDKKTTSALIKEALSLLQ
ncbi:MAG: Holliday junction branch migration protein RuvA [Candidatus Paceibacterota bacterium]